MTSPAGPHLSGESSTGLASELYFQAHSNQSGLRRYSCELTALCELVCVNCQGHRVPLSQEAGPSSS